MYEIHHADRGGGFLQSRVARAKKEKREKFPLSPLFSRPLSQQKAKAKKPKTQKDLASALLQN
jgi:hypothetical protein